MTTLYQLNNETREIFSLAESGEIDEQTFADTWESLQGERSDKMSSYCDLYKCWMASAEAIKSESRKLAQRAMMIERRAEGLKNYLRMQIADREAFETPRHKFVWRSSVATVIDDEKNVPAEYLIPQPPKVDKKAIGEDLKAIKKQGNGESFAFAYLEERLNFTIK